MTKRMEKMKLQTDLKQLQSYRSSLDSFKANLENKVSELTNELENSGKSEDVPFLKNYLWNMSRITFGSSLVHSQSPGVSKTRAGRPADPAAEPEVYSCWCGKDQQREEGAPADHHQPQQVSGRCWTAQVERGDRSGQSQGEGTPFAAGVFGALNGWLSPPPDLSRICPVIVHWTQAELRLSEYHKLARKLKLIPLSAENACGHDFEIRPFECGSNNTVQHKTQIQVCFEDGCLKVRGQHVLC